MDKDKKDKLRDLNKEYSIFQVVQSPNGTHFALFVDDNGKLNTIEI